MKDIAKDLGVSVVTVSKVLRNHSDIGEATRERVLQRIKELDYRPNLTARSLVTGRSYLVGLVVPDLLHPFFAEVARALSNSLKEDGYYLIISSSEEDPELEEHEVDQLLARRLDALVIASSRSTVELFFRIEKQKTPYVLIDRNFSGLRANFVGVDDEAVGMLATRHLVDVGCKRIAHIRGPENNPGIRRLEGYKRILAQQDIKLPHGYIVSPHTVDAKSRESGAEAMSKLLKLNPKPDAVFCYNDPLALGAIDCVLEKNLRIPEDIAIIGCGNLHYDSLLRVPLSSIDQQSRRIGKEAARLTLGLLKKSKVAPAPESVILEPRLVARASTLGHSKAVTKAAARRRL
jgi:LacI family transcriptional regulator